MAKNVVTWTKVLKILDEVYAEGYCSSGVTKPAVVYDENGPGVWPLANGCKIGESDTGDLYMYDKTDGWGKLFSFKQE